MSAKVLPNLALDHVRGLYPEIDHSSLQESLKEVLQRSPAKIIVLDDDPTGVQTVHDTAVLTNWDEASIEQCFLESSPLFFILTNSRALTSEQTRILHNEIAHNIANVYQRLKIPFIIISRSDSTLRGHYPLETEVLRSIIENETGIVFDGEVICPFFKEGGRLTIDNIHYAREGDVLIPVGQTEFAKDKTFGYSASHLGKWIEEKTAGTYKAQELTYISLKQLREGDIESILSSLLTAKDFGKIIVNSIDYADLEVFVLALLKAMEAGKRFLFRTAASFPKVIAGIEDRPLLQRSELIDPATRNGGLVVIGSHVKKTSIQLEQLRTIQGLHFFELNVHLAADKRRFKAEIGRVGTLCRESIEKGVTTVLYTSRERIDINSGNKEDELKIAAIISAALVEIVGTIGVKPRFILAKGGITSSDIGTRALKVKRALVLGQVLPGIPVWLTGPESLFPTTPYIIFPGNVGDDDSLKKIVAMLM